LDQQGCGDAPPGVFESRRDLTAPYNDRPLEKLLKGQIFSPIPELAAFAGVGVVVIAAFAAPAAMIGRAPHP
jgi:hypothetical protein